MGRQTRLGLDAHPSAGRPRGEVPTKTPAGGADPPSCLGREPTEAEPPVRPLTRPIRVKTVFRQAKGVVNREEGEHHTQQGADSSGQTPASVRCHLGVRGWRRTP